MRRLVFIGIAAAILASSSKSLKAETPITTDAKVHDLAEKLRLAMGGSEIIDRTFEALRSGPIQLIMQKGHATMEKASSVCDDILMPAMKAHSFGLNESLVDIYKRNFSQAELEQLIAFYQSPVGLKLVAKLPVMVVESGAAGRAWGARVARVAIAEHQREIQQRGITL